MGKFKGLFDEATPKREGTPKSPAKKATEKSAPAPARRGRPRVEHSKAKRTDPDYSQLLAYVKKDVHRKVMSRLALEDGELSALVERLLETWLNS